MKTTEERFWEKVIKTRKCWIWNACIQKGGGYGLFAMEGKLQLTHRLSWKMHNGPIPKGLFVLHHCDNPPCVRPDHLFLGTQKDNMRDKVEKGREARGDRHGMRTRPDRVPRGERNGCAKTTDEEVVEMRERYAAGEISQPQLARQYGLTQATVNDILTGKRWQHVGGAITKRGRKSLNAGQVNQIRSLLKNGVPRADIARRFGVRWQSIEDIRSGKSWAHK